MEHCGQLFLENGCISDKCPHLYVCSSIVPRIICIWEYSRNQSDFYTNINKDLVINKHVKNSDMNRRFGVFMTPLSR